MMDLDAQNAQMKINAFDKKVIYVYKHLDVVSHEGWLKVGETKQSRIKGDGANLRIEEQHEASNVAYEVLYTTSAVTNDGRPFSDHDIHTELVTKGIDREKTQNPRTNRESEWFKTDLQTVIDTIYNYKANAVVNDQGVITAFNLRTEQQDAVNITQAYYERTLDDVNIQPEFLWNAKPRFGKTLTSYSFAQSIRAQKVLIITNRPAIADSWFTDFKKFDFKYNGNNDNHRWIFTASDSVKKNLVGNNSPEILTRQEQLQNPDLINQNIIHFISLQDIKGQSKTADDYKAKNKWIFKGDKGTDTPGIEWDLLIIDESHEGVDTGKSFRTLESVNYKFALHLSGTPFKALASQKFNSSQIYNWSYTDEQFAKEEWNLEDGNNPYASLPKLNIFTYQLSRALQVTAEEAKDEGSEYAFDLGEFFRVVKIDGKDTFAYEDKVQLFLDNLANPRYQYPFSDRDSLDALRHTFWLLPSVKSCILLKAMLGEHEFFNDYQIVLAAGNGDEDRITNSALGEVREAIYGRGGNKHPLETKTITLSVGQLTTGVTVPAWTAVLMLNNVKSPALYMQTAFRAQNAFEVATSGGETYTKENSYVFDFAPDRILQTLAEMAQSSGPGGKPREEKVQELINFLPVIAEDDEGRMHELSANEVLTIPLKLITQEVVSRGFMSNRLFDNISGIFGAPQSVMDIIAKMTPDEGGKMGDKEKNKPKPKPRIWQDAENKIHINEDIVINTSGKDGDSVFGAKKYVEIGSEEEKEVRDILTDTVTQMKAKNIPTATQDVIIKELTKKLPKAVAKIPDPAPQPGDPDYFEKEKLDNKPAPKEKSEEEKTRDRLRGFARTIPSFLMAYGDSNTTIATFEANIPDDVFVELTSITKYEFRQLRDGFEYDAQDEETGETKKHRFEGLFNQDIFNASVQAFNEKRAELADYYLADHEEDIFEYIPPQATNQIFTPKRVVRMMLDGLEAEAPELFRRTDSTFIDPYVKSGLYITETAKRIFANTRHQYASDLDCIKHILENQVYGLAPTGVLHAITNSFIFGFDDSHQVSNTNFAQHDLLPEAKDGKAQAKLNELFNKGGNEMIKFDAVVGNPPYQGENHQQIYTDFYLSARSIGDWVSLIFPIGWQEPKSANNLSKLNTPEIKEDRQIISIDNRQNVFQGIAGAEWTNIILWARGYDNGLGGKQRILTNGENPVVKKLATDKSDIEKHIEIVELANIVMAKKDFSTTQKITSVLKPYGLRTDFLNDPKKYDLPEYQDNRIKDDDVKLYGLLDRRQVVKYVPKTYPFPRKTDAFDKYKVLMGKAWGNFSNGYLGGAYADIVIAAPNEAATENFIESGAFDDYETAKKHAKYLMTRFARALLYRNKHTQDNSPDKWKAVPIQDYSEPWWNKSIDEIDAELMNKYDVPENIRKFVEDNIQRKTEANIVNYNLREMS